MLDFFPEAITGRHSQEVVASCWHDLYDLTECPNIWLGLNLQWPQFDLPMSYTQYLVSWHTEYMDVTWLHLQCQRVYPAQVICVTDWPCDLSHLQMDNLLCLQIDTMHKQIAILKDRFGIATDFVVPTYKISSLSSRVSQYKKFVTAYLLANVPHHDIILTWHHYLGKLEDMHGHEVGLAHIENLDFGRLNSAIFLNFNDGYNQTMNSPINNGDWRVDAYTDSLINFSNESFHYSLTTDDGIKFWCYPGPYLTEKTWKPLLAGRPFLAVGQAYSYQRLASQGLCTDFGFEHTYDQDSGDLTRIDKIFRVIDDINQRSLQELFDRSEAACRHNLAVIGNGELADRVRQNNNFNIDALKNL